MSKLNDNGVFDLLEGGVNIDLFDTGDEPVGPIAAGYELPPKAQESNTDNIHNALMAVGLTPGIGNIADAADAILYGLEGEFGMAALSAASMLPIAGQYIAAQKALKKAQDAGEKIITVYRGVDKWHPGSMVKNGRFVGGGKYLGEYESQHLKNWGKGINKNDAWVTTKKEYATGEYMKGKPVREILLEFHIPESIYKKNFLRTGILQGDAVGIFSQGVPKEFLTKVHKYNVK
jgi:hypothetical protein